VMIKKFSKVYTCRCFEPRKPFLSAISFINLVKFINYYQMPRSILSKLFVIASGGGEANVYGSSYYWNFRTSSFKQVACLILKVMVIGQEGFSWFKTPACVHLWKLFYHHISCRDICW
jgi:hypothetical protein